MSIENFDDYARERETIHETAQRWARLIDRNIEILNQSAPIFEYSEIEHIEIE